MRRLGRSGRRAWMPLHVESVAEIFDFLLKLAGDFEGFEGGLFLGWIRGVLRFCQDGRLGNGLHF